METMQTDQRELLLRFRSLLLLLLRHRLPLLPVRIYFLLTATPPNAVTKNADAQANTHRETRRKTLEEIAAAFGDKVVMLTEREMTIEEAIAGDKIVAAEHVERV